MSRLCRGWMRTCLILKEKGKGFHQDREIQLLLNWIHEGGREVAGLDSGMLPGSSGTDGS